MPIESKSEKERRLPPLKWVGLTLFSLLFIGAITAALAFPRLVERQVHQELENLETRLGIDLSVVTVGTRGLNTLELTGLEVKTPSGELLATIEEVSATLSRGDLLRGQPRIEAFVLKQTELIIHRYDDGRTTFDEFRRAERPSIEAGDDDSEPGESARPLDRINGLLRYFGELLPETNVESFTLRFVAPPEAPWPLSELRVDSFSLPRGAEAPYSFTVALIPQDHHRLALPSEIQLDGILRVPLERSTLALIFSEPLRAKEIPRAPFTEASLKGFAIEEDFTIALTEPGLLARTGPRSEPLGSASLVSLRFDQWPQSRDEISLLEVDVEGLSLAIEYNEKGASNLGDLLSLVRQPAAREVSSRAREITTVIASERESDDDPPSDGDAAPGASSGTQDSPPQPLLAGLSIRDLFTLLPQHTRIRDFTLLITDARPHPLLMERADQIRVSGEAFDLRHRPIQGVLDGKVAFTIDADGRESSTDIDFRIPYRRGDWNAKVDIDDLQLANLAQIGGSRVAEKLQGGSITATLEISNDREGTGRTTFDGLFAARDIHVHFPSFAEGPLEVETTSLRLKGYYDPKKPVPAPTLIRTGSSLPSDEPQAEEEEFQALPLDEVAEESDVSKAPTKGAILLEEATARLGDVEATFSLGLYGVDGLRMPNRAALDIQLPNTDLMAIYAAIPTAILGPFQGTRLQGSLTWDFSLEVPFYEASHMRWDANVQLSDDFHVHYLPSQVDVFVLTDAFEHRIRDEWETTYHHRRRKLIYDRKVQIPAMRPIPAPWLMENAGLELAQIDRIRRRRDWPPVPKWDSFDRSHGLDRETLESKEYWLSQHALRQQAPYPFNDPDPGESTVAAPTSFWESFRQQPSSFDPYNDERVVLFETPRPPGMNQSEIILNPERYGPYVYVPLHHISPYLPRAIMTTEDGSFFTHRGFNFLAIRHSVEANINAGRFVRGASTISMQLAKNLFLDRSRVLSRKLQEVALVWLMESVAQIPKERLLELYLNVIEFGPGVYGINDASVHYFGKRPDELSISEVAWLVSIVPSPKRHHIHYDRGEIPRWFFNRMSRYIRAMYHRDRLTAEEMEYALGDHPTFYIPEDGEPVLRRYAPSEQEEEFLDAPSTPADQEARDDGAVERP